MGPNLPIDLDAHRHSDGSIDFDFYRRRSARRRQAQRRRIFRRTLTRLAEAPAAALAPLAGLVVSRLIARLQTYRPLPNEMAGLNPAIAQKSSKRSRVTAS